MALAIHLKASIHESGGRGLAQGNPNGARSVAVARVEERITSGQKQGAIIGIPRRGQLS